MNNIILCEGSTDYFLLQYYMREAHQWIDDKSIQSGILKMPRQKSRNLIKKYYCRTSLSYHNSGSLKREFLTALWRPSTAVTFWWIQLGLSAEAIDTKAIEIETMENRKKRLRYLKGHARIPYERLHLIYSVRLQNSLRQSDHSW